jgi:hypothetical protein
MPRATLQRSSGAPLASLSNWWQVIGGATVRCVERGLILCSLGGRLHTGVEFWLLTFLLYGFISGAGPTTLKELVGLEPGHEIVTLNTRPGVTVRVLGCLLNKDL